MADSEPDILTLDVILADLESMGFHLEVEDGVPRLKGDRTQATPALMAVLRRRRDEIVRRLAGREAAPPPPPSRLEPLFLDIVKLIGKCRNIKPMGFLDDFERIAKDAYLADDEQRLRDTFQSVTRVYGNLKNPPPPEPDNWIPPREWYAPDEDDAFVLVRDMVAAGLEVLLLDGKPVIRGGVPDAEMVERLKECREPLLAWLQSGVAGVEAYLQWEAAHG